MKEEMTAIRDRLKGKPAETPYAYREGEPWNAALKSLPPSCVLWQRYREYDEVRSAYDEAQALRGQWIQELGAINARLKAGTPDTTSGDVWGADYLRGKQIEFHLGERQETDAGLQDAARRAAETWGETWGAYADVLTWLWQLDNTTPEQLLTSPAGYGERGARRLQIEEQRRYYEAPQG